MLRLTPTDCVSPVRSAEQVLTEHLDDGRRPLALALSGGGDSIALLRAAAPWAAAHGRPLVALTVDHGLHPQSRDWTAFAGHAAEQAGVAWRGLTWSGPKPAAGLPAAARAARHRLLADAARSWGASVLLVAHTADDVAESDWMRRRGAPTLGRLRAWSPSPAWPEGRDLFLLRPFLTQKRAGLRSWLGALGALWLDDPANEDLRFGRARARAALAQTSEAPPAAAAAALQMASALRTLGARFQISGEGALRMRRADLTGDPAVASRMLAIAATCASGAAAPPRGRTLRRLADRCQTQAAFVAAVGGARMMADGAHLVIAREPGDLTRRPPPAAVVAAGEEGVWDGRFVLRAEQTLAVTRLGGCAARLSAAERSRLRQIAPAVRATMPALMIDGEVCLPRPWGLGPAEARPLAGRRFLAACGLLTHEREIAKDCMANDRQSSYVDVLALA